MKMTHGLAALVYSVSISGCLVLHSRDSRVVHFLPELATLDSVGPVFADHTNHTVHCGELLDHDAGFSYRNVVGETVWLQSVDSVALGSAYLHRLSLTIEGPRDSELSAMAISAMRTMFLICSPDGFAEVSASLLSEYNSWPLASIQDRFLLGSVSTDWRHLRIRPGIIIPTTLHEKVYQVEELGGAYRVWAADSVAIGPLFALGGWEVDPEGRLRFRRRIPSAALCPTAYGLRRCSVAWVFRGPNRTPQPTRQ
jgi:hypothetical protein